MQIYLDKETQWDGLIARIRDQGVCGFDTEFYNVNVKKQSCVGRARIHVFSLAIRTKTLHPRGFHVCRGWVLPVAALDYPPMRALLEDESIRKEIHNESVDSHSLANHKIRLAGGRNTLGLIRYYRPELVKQPGRFALKPLMMSLFGREPVCEYEDVVNDVRPYAKIKLRKMKARECSCGAMGCKFRKGHTKTDIVITEEQIVESEEEYQIPLESIVPGHPRFDLLCRYAAEDAVAALETAEIADDAAKVDPAPWPYEDFAERPAFDQRLEEAIILMESVGIPIDVNYCSQKLPEAEADKEQDLAWLYRWYVVNSGIMGPHRRCDVDAIWTSHQQKLSLFDSLNFPHSPVWKKGKVKRDEVKLDGAAQAWIALNYPPSKQLINKLLHYQRVTSGIKYLKKLTESGGIVHPTFGPASDADDRAGAVTGRLGCKLELEAQQLPSRAEADLYQIKKALIAW